MDKIIILNEDEIYDMPKPRNLASIHEMDRQAKQMGCDLDFVVAYNNGWNDCLKAMGAMRNEKELTK